MGLGTMCSDLIHDIKSSIRFKVALVLWLPFFIVICIGVSKFDAKLNASTNVPGWRVAVFNQSSVEFPAVSFWREDGLPYFTGRRCSYAGPNQNNSLDISKCPGSSKDLSECFTVDGTKIMASPSPYNEIICQLDLGNLTGDGDIENDVFAVSFPGGWTDTEVVYITPNGKAVVDFTKTTFLPTGQPAVNQWRATVTYRSSIEPPNAATVVLRIGAFNILTYTQYVWFDQWQFQGAFGGIVFFYWVWFQLLYRFLKNFLPNDSKVLGTELPPGGTPGYAPQPDAS